jgi:hypothetical protein
VTAAPENDQGLFRTTWVHVFEEDAGENAVYRPDDGPIPLSRRPRRRFKLDHDGSATLFIAGSDDRYVEQPATWSDEQGVLTVQATGRPMSFRVVERSASRLLVRMARE